MEHSMHLLPYMASLPVYQRVRLSRMTNEITECGASFTVAGPKPFQLRRAGALVRPERLP